MTASGREFNWLSKKLENNLLLRRNKDCTNLPLKQSISRLDQDIALNIENTLCLAYDIYVLGDFNLFMMKGSHYNWYNDLVLLGLDQLIVGVVTMTAWTDHVYCDWRRWVGQYITRWQPYYITAMLGSPDNQSDTAVDTGGFENCLLAIAQWYEVA